MTDVTAVMFMCSFVAQMYHMTKSARVTAHVAAATNCKTNLALVSLLMIFLQVV